MRALPPKTEVVVVGGGPAGLVTALSLIRQNPNLADRMVVVEKGRYPRDKTCAGAIGGRGDATLARLGVVCDVPSVPVFGISLRVSIGLAVEREAVPIGRVVRRIEFDHALARAAQSAGVRIHDGVMVLRAVRTEGGWRAETSQGSIQSRILVGADGVGSVVRRTAGVRDSRLKAQAVEVDTRACAADMEPDLLRFEAAHAGIPGYCWDFPTIVDGRRSFCRGAYVLQIGTKVPSAVQMLAQHLASRGLDPSLLRYKRFAERGYCTGSVTSLPGMILVGEAAGIDPVTGEGIPQALAYGEHAGRYIAEAIESGDCRFDDWPKHIAQTRLGFDLRVREKAAARFYGGQDRAWLERLLVERPWFLRAGMQYFSGKHVPRSAILRVGLFGLRLWVGSIISEFG